MGYALVPKPGRLVWQLLLLGWFLPGFSLSAGGESQGYFRDEGSLWKAHAAFQVHFVSGAASPLIGPALSYSFRHTTDVGFNTWLPISGNTMYSADLFLREYFGAGGGRIFVEPRLSLNFLTQKSTPIPSLALGVGIALQLSEDISLGSSVALEMYSLEAILSVTPKVLVSTAFAF